MFFYYLKLAFLRCRQGFWVPMLAALTMGIGIAACITTLAIFSALETEPLPGISGHLFVVTMDARETPDTHGAGSAYVHPNSLLALRDAKALVDAPPKGSGKVAVATVLTPVRNANNAKSVVVSGLLAYGNVLNEMGVPLRFGRAWSAGEQISRDPVAVIDTVVARKLFGNSDAVGRSVEINGRLFRVVGVTAPWKPKTQFIDATSGEAIGDNAQIFLPVDAALEASVEPQNSGECESKAGSTAIGSLDVRSCRWLEVWASLTSSSKFTAYRQVLENYGEAQYGSGRFEYQPDVRLYRTREWMALNHVVPNDVQLNLLLASSFLVLCMMNAVGLLTARFLHRQSDVAIRRALGASRTQIFAQHLLESLFLGLLAAVFALPLTLLGTWIVRKQPVAYAAAAQFSPSMFVALLALALLVGTLVGVLPAWRMCSLPPAIQIKQA